MDQRNLTLPPPDATTIMSSSSAIAMAMASVATTVAAPTTSGIATTTATTTPATFFTYSIPGMDISPGPFIFTYVSEFLSLITPEEMPLVEPDEPVSSNPPQMSNEQKVDTFMKKHGVREDIARQYLTANGWVLDQASFRYESDKDGRNNNPTKEDTASLPDPQSLHSLISQHTNRNATDKDEGYFAGASESSGQQIGGPKRVSIENSTPALTTNDSDRSIRAWGTGIRLGSAHPINPPPARSDSEDSELQTETEHTIVVLHLWSEGFSLDDGSLRPYEVPENERFLRAVLRGDYPHEMQEFGHRVELSVQDHTNERFRHLSRKQFMGSGRLLGSPSPRVESATTPQSIPTADLTPEQRAESGLHFNEKLPMTVIQLRLADGSRVAARFNLTHIIADIYRYIRLARPHYSSQRFILITAFPRQQLDETDPRTLGQADLRNVLVIQHLCEDPDDEQTQSDESIRDVLHNNVSLIDFASNAIKIESGFLALMSIFAILALVPLIATCAWCCGRRSTQDEIDRIRKAPVHIRDESLEENLQCRKSAGLVTLWIIFVLLTLSDFSIFYANSRLSAGIEMSPEMVKSAVHDVEVFLKDTHLQIKHKLDNGFHVSVERVVKDLEDVDVLLGEPIQAEISAHTGLELAYDSLTTLSLANAELIYRVLMLQETVGRALKLSQEAAARMEELQIQLSVLQRQCTYRDRPLCDTLRIRSFEENGVVDALKTLQEDQSIFRMRYLGEIEFGATVKNLTSEVGVSRSIFSNFPQQVKHDTAYERNYTLEQLASIRHRTTANAQLLTSTINALLQRLERTWPNLQPLYNDLKDWADAYWSIGWIAGLVIVWVILFMLMSYCCFLCESNTKSGVVFFVAVMIICLASICLTVYGIISLAIGGNTEVFLCRSLYGESNYDMLGKLFDKPGYVYEREPQTGIIGELLRPAGVNRSVVNVSLGKALRGCEQNQASYNVFQLDAFVNTTKIADLKQFPKVSTAIDAISVSERTMLSLTQSIQNILENMLQTSTFNLTTYRSSVGAPTPEKDLATFIDQMQRVALQIQDVATSSRMTTLGSRSKRLQASILQPLENLQNEILYHLTALELQRDPWAKQVNQTLNHLKSIQGYLENKAGEICHNMTRAYTERLKAYLTSSRATMESQLGDTTTKCRPFYDTFDASRTFLCRNMVDFINGLTFCIFLTLLLWAIGTPVGLNLITIQTRLNVMQEAESRKRHRRSDQSRGRERDQESGRGRKKQRSTSSAKSKSKSSASRDRSSSSTARAKPRPPLRRTATEETLDLADEDSTPSRQHHEPQQEQRRPEPERERSRERELSRGREMTNIGTPVRSRSRQQQLRNDPVDDNWGGNSSSGPSRANSNERERESQSRKVLNIWQSRNKYKPPLRKQGTEEYDFQDDQAPDNEQDSGWRAQNNSASQSVSPEPTTRHWQAPAENQFNLRTKQKSRSTNTERGEIIRRPVTPVLKVNPDIPAAVPMPRTPMRLRSKVSLTARAVQDIVNKRSQRLQRTGTDEFDLDESDTYGTGGHLDADVAAARRTPPRNAPPPPPPPAAGLNRYNSSERTVRWNEANDDEEDFHFEDVDSPNPMYLSHNLH